MCKIGWILTLSVVWIVSVGAVPERDTLFSVEYFYADNGMVTGRKVNGDMQHYRYDKRRQLLSVTDAKGRILECYNYDPAGNILSKTIDGRTTTYLYDAANQLVASTVDGRTTRYEYDAAGRLIREGGKEYKYGYLDKILAVQENGRTVAAFDYHVGGQIARAMTDTGTESYLWDGLALIRRDETNLVNEPYVTGGNPIISGDDVLFNDMLGSTLGIRGQQNTRIAMTAFGETPNSNAYFTGKPQVGELGYAFLFRNYRPDQGKWQTQDPLGYPDGWNNFAYVNNNVIALWDARGLCTELLTCSAYFDGIPKQVSYTVTICTINAPCGGYEELKVGPIFATLSGIQAQAFNTTSLTILAGQMIFYVDNRDHESPHSGTVEERYFTEYRYDEVTRTYLCGRTEPIGLNGHFNNTSETLSKCIHE